MGCDEEVEGGSEWEERMREWAWRAGGGGRMCLRGLWLGNVGVQVDFDRLGDLVGVGWERMGVGIYTWEEERG